MQGRKEFTPKLMYQFRLDELVSQDNYYRHLDSVLDLYFLYKATESYYGDEGQESIDPVVFFKICLVGYLNNINSDRRLMEYCSNCMDIRLFIRYDLDEKLPWHSTISRTRQLYGEEVFLDMFRKVLKMCIDKGMVRGKRQAVDSALIKANASMDSLKEKELLDDSAVYAEELNQGSEYQVTAQKKKDVEAHHSWKKETYKDMPGHGREERIDEFGNEIRPRFLSNHTHYSPTDSDARIAVKPGKARQMTYFGQISVDDSNHVITGAGADFSDQRDSQCLEKIAEQAIGNLATNGLEVEQLLADTGYSSGEALEYMENKGIDAWIPNFGQYKPVREGFEYNAEPDRYECTRGNRAVLPYRKTFTDSKGYTKKIYRSNNEKCKQCPLRKACIGKSDFKKIEDSIYKPYYDRMHGKLNRDKAYTARMLRIRSSTVEPVLGTLINFLNMKRVNTRGIDQANKHVMMAALAYNLKKYMKFNSRRSQAAVNRVEKNQKEAFNAFFDCFRHIPALTGYRMINCMF